MVAERVVGEVDHPGWLVREGTKRGLAPPAHARPGQQRRRVPPWGDRSGDRHSRRHELGSQRLAEAGNAAPLRPFEGADNHDRSGFSHTPIVGRDGSIGQGGT